MSRSLKSFDLGAVTKQQFVPGPSEERPQAKEPLGFYTPSLKREKSGVLSECPVTWLGHRSPLPLLYKRVLPARAL